MIEIQPQLTDEYQRLCDQGQQFLEQQSVVLESTYIHPQKGERSVCIDPQTLAQQGAIYVGNAQLSDQMRQHNLNTTSWQTAADLLSEQLHSEDTLVWGFSGYATGGVNKATQKPFGYQEEGDGLRVLYAHLSDQDQSPGIAIDGGVSEGFLALNSVVARSAGISTLGFIPLQGLSSVGIRDHMVVAGNTYRDRETFVGTADILACAGGDQGTARECHEAVSRGAAVLLMALKEYPQSSLPKTYQTHEDLRRAYKTGQLVVCESIDDLPDSVDRLLEYDTHAGRPYRQAAIEYYFSGAA